MREFRARLDTGARLRVQGTARDEPERLLRGGLRPHYRLELFDTVFYLSAARQNPNLRFLLAWVKPQPPARPDLHARILYKDVSLVWRSASHYVPAENWIGKGDVTVEVNDGWEDVASQEETSDLPFELQDALETVNHNPDPVRTDHVTVGRVLRNAPRHRIAPYEDFCGPRRRAAADPRNRLNGGRPIARFTRANDPASLRFARGYEPDFDGGVIERRTVRSHLYGGRVDKYRVLSVNGRIQYLFFAAPRHVWLAPPQTLATELSSYGLRTTTVDVHEHLCVPGYEFHYLEETDDEPVFVTQIPEGYAGKPHPDDDSRADARAWLDALPVVRDFRRRVLGRG